MRSAVILVSVLGVLGGCEFHATPASNEAPPVDAAGGGGGGGGSGGSGSDASTGTPPAFCDKNDSTIIACYEFENDTKDGSSHRLDARADHVTYMPGKVGMALKFDQDSNADVNDNMAFDVSALTIEAWIKPSELPQDGTTVANILDVNNQYAFQVMDNGDLQCKLIGGKTLTSAAGVTVNQWMHVACTYDSATGMSAIYVNGVQHDGASGGNTLATNGNTGLSLSADNPPPSGPLFGPSPPERNRLIGLIDQVRLTSVARNAVQICADSGLATCR